MNRHHVIGTFGLLLLSHSLGGCLGDDSGSAPVVRPGITDPATAAPDEPTGASFHFGMSRGCNPFEGDACPVDHPLMTGVDEFVRFDVAGVHRNDDAIATSSDPRVVGVVHADVSGALEGSTYRGLFAVHALAPGSATITLTRAGVTLGAFVLRVATPARLVVVREPTGNPSPTEAVDQVALRTGESWSMNGVPYDANGEPLYANNGVEWTVPDTTHVNLNWARQSGARIVDDHVYVEGRAPGSVALTARAGSVTRTLDVQVQ